MRTDEDTPYTFRAGDFNFSGIVAGDTLASVKIVTWPSAGTLALDGTAVTADQSVSKADIDAGRLVFTPAANGNGAPYARFLFQVSDGDEESASGYTMSIDVTPVNDPATGKPTVSGTAEVGHALTASTSAIADIDGLPGTFAYRWVRVDGATETVISGATRPRYVLTSADEGKQLEVEASFTDRDGTRGVDDQRRDGHGSGEHEADGFGWDGHHRRGHGLHVSGKRFQLLGGERGRHACEREDGDAASAGRFFLLGTSARGTESVSEQG